MKRHTAAALCAAFLFLIAFPAAAKWGDQDGGLGVRNWWIPQKTITGFNLRMSGNSVWIEPTTETLQGGPSGTIMLTTTIASTSDVNALPKCRVAACGPGSEFNSPTDRRGSLIVLSAFISDIQNRNFGDLVEYSLPPVVFSSRSGRQPRLTNRSPAPAGFVSVEDLIKEAADLGRPLTYAQRAALQKLAANEPLVPGKVYVTLLLRFDLTKLRFVIDRAVYKFEPVGEWLLDELPPLDTCPPGTEGTPPDCKTPLPPAPPPAPGPTCPGDLIGKYPDCYPPPAGCPSCGPIDPEGKVELFR